MLIGSDKIYIGYDLSYGYAQISYCRQLDDTPETYSLTEGTEQYNIPVSLFKRKGINQWFSDFQSCCGSFARSINRKTINAT